MPGHLRLGGYRGREQTERSGDGGDKHAYTHHCSHQAANRGQGTNGRANGSY